MCINLLCVLGILYIISLVNRYSYRVLPEIKISGFFTRKLGVKEVSSLKEYIVTKIKIYSGLKKIGSIKENDISDYDIEALNELRRYMNTELKQYIKNLTVNRHTYMVSHCSHIQYELKHGILDFYMMSRNDSLIDSIRISFESFSDDNPSLEISNFENSINAIYTYKIKSKYFRFINPPVELINDINQIVEGMSYRNIYGTTVSLQVA